MNEGLIITTTADAINVEHFPNCAEAIATYNARKQAVARGESADSMVLHKLRRGGNSRCVKPREIKRPQSTPADKGENDKAATEETEAAAATAAAELAAAEAEAADKGEKRKPGRPKKNA